jgi:AbiJ N-terminal domain 4
MAIYETFSKRQKRLANAGQQDVYQYETLPDRFRGQVAHIWTTAIGHYHVPTRFDFRASLPSPSNKYWNLIHDTLARDLGLPYLSDPFEDINVRCTNYLLTAPTLEALDIIQLSFQVIDKAIREMNGYDMQTAGITQSADGAIEDLNGRFLEHNIGYQYLNGQIVRLDSQFAHEEIVKPALSLLNTAGFDGPAEEFIKAFDHYKHERNKEAVVEALKAFESTMKAICDTRKWLYPSTATAKDLIKILFDKGMIPAELQSHFAGLRSVMEAGLPTVRNKTSGHGQGSVSVTIPPHVVAYALHLAASNIVFCVEAHKSLK